MYLEGQKVRTDHYYTVGYCPDLDRYLMVITVPGAVYYEQYYTISRAEYALWQSDVKKLDLIAEKCRQENTGSRRFFYSDRPDENTEERQALSRSEIARKRHNPVFDRI